MKTELKPLTGLRGVAAVIVMIYHYGRPYFGMGVNTHFHVRQGYIAVDCFYILSGFVLALSYGEWFSGRFDIARYGGFMLRRVARLYPAYLVIMAVIFLKTVINVSHNGALSHYKAHDYILNFLMMTGIGLHVYPIIGDSWSVSAEMVAYFFFPVLVFLAVFCRPAIAAMVFCFAVGGLMLVVHSGLGKEGPLDVVDNASLYPALRCVAGFTIGLLLFRISKLPSLRVLMTSEMLCGFIVLVTAAAWALDAPDLFLFVCLMALVFALSFDGTVANKLFGNRPVHYLGEISYSLYLIHPAFISVAVSLTVIAQRHLKVDWLYPLFAVIFWALSIKLAGYSARWIEGPGRRWVMDSAVRILPLKNQPPEKGIGPNSAPVAYRALAPQRHAGEN